MRISTIVQINGTGSFYVAGTLVCWVSTLILQLAWDYKALLLLLVVVRWSVLHLPSVVYLQCAAHSQDEVRGKAVRLV